MAEDSREILIPVGISLNYDDAVKKAKALDKKLNDLMQKKEIKVGLQSEAEEREAAAGQKVLRGQNRIAELEKAISGTGKSYVDPETWMRNKEELDREKEQLKENEKELDAAFKTVSKIEGEVEKINSEIGVTKTQLDDIMNSEAMQQGQQTEPLTEEVKEKVEEVKEVAKQEMEVVADTTEKVAQKVDFQMDKLARRIVGLAKRVFVFSMITKALRSVRTYVSSLLGANEEYNKSLARLKAAALTFIQPIMNVVVPVAIRVMNILGTILGYLTKAIALLFGFNIQDWAAQAQSGYASVQKSAKGAADAQKELNKQLADFDELNVISSDRDTGSEAGAGAGASPDWGFVDSLDGELERLSAIIIGAALVIGTILVVTGANIPLGLGLMVTGALLLFHEARTNDNLKEMLQGKLGTLITFGSVALMALGLILMLTGAHFALGLGMFVLGAIGSFTVAAANWDSLGNTLSDKITTLLQYVGMALMGIGLVLLLAGHPLLGIGILITGLAAYAVGANWDSLGATVGDKVLKILEYVGMALMAIGLVLLLSGHILIGIGILAAGYVTYEAAVNWNLIGATMGEKILYLARLIGTALMVVGFVLLFAGHFALGLGLIIAGYTMKKTAENWNSLGETMGEKMKGIAQIVSDGLLYMGVACIMLGHFALGLGFIIASKMIKEAIVKWDSLGDNVSSTMEAIIDIIMPNMVYIGIILCLMGMWPLGLAAVGLWWLWETNDGDTQAFLDRISTDFGQVNGIVSAFLTGLTSSFENAYSTIKNNTTSLIDFIRGEFSKDQAIDNIVKQYMNTGSMMPSWNRFQVPGYASGNVVPPNKKFLAVLGDNKNEPEVVSPISTMKQAFFETMNEMGGRSGSTDDLLRQLISVVASKELTVAPSVNLARAVDRSNAMYRGVTG